MTSFKNMTVEALVGYLGQEALSAEDLKSLIRDLALGWPGEDLNRVAYVLPFFSPGMDIPRYVDEFERRFKIDPSNWPDPRVFFGDEVVPAGSDLTDVELRSFLVECTPGQISELGSRAGTPIRSVNALMISDRAKMSEIVRGLSGDGAWPLLSLTPPVLEKEPEPVIRRTRKVAQNTASSPVAKPGPVQVSERIPQPTLKPSVQAPEPEPVLKPASTDQPVAAGNLGKTLSDVGKVIASDVANVDKRKVTWVVYAILAVVLGVPLLCGCLGVTLLLGGWVMRAFGYFLGGF